MCCTSTDEGCEDHDFGVVGFGDGVSREAERRRRTKRPIAAAFKNLPGVLRGGIVAGGFRPSGRRPLRRCLERSKDYMMGAVKVEFLEKLGNRGA
jgi:hypothetical protein